MRYTLIFACLLAQELRPSISLPLPSLDEWINRCNKTLPLAQMPGLQEFLVKNQKHYFEQFCLKNRISSWPEINIIKGAFQKALAQRLNNPSNWVGGQTIEMEKASLYNAYYVGVNVPQNSQLYCWGDRHGDARSLPFGLKATGVANQQWAFPKEKIPVLLGDYLNNGCYSLEAALIAMMIYINNPNCIAIRGNHECTSRPITQDWAIREAEVKLAEQLGDQAGKEAISLFQLLEKLPVAAFVGFPGENKEQKHLLITHAAPDVGINPHRLISTLKSSPLGQFWYCAIHPATYNRNGNLNPTAHNIINTPEYQKDNPGFETYLRVTRESDPRDLSLCRDQLVNQDPKVPFQYFEKITTLAWGLPLIKAIMHDWKLFCILRSHQHAHALDCLKNPALLFPMRELWKGNGASFAWKENSANQEREIEQNDVMTVQVAPDSIYGLREEQITGNPQTENSYPGFSHDTIAVLTIIREGQLTLSCISIGSLNIATNT